MEEDRGRRIPSAGGLLLFGMRPNRYLPQSGITGEAVVNAIAHRDDTITVTDVFRCGISGTLMS